MTRFHRLLTRLMVLAWMLAASCSLAASEFSSSSSSTASASDLPSLSAFNLLSISFSVWPLVVGQVAPFSISGQWLDGVGALLLARQDLHEQLVHPPALANLPSYVGPSSLPALSDWAVANSYTVIYASGVTSTSWTLSGGDSNSSVISNITIDQSALPTAGYHNLLAIGLGYPVNVTDFTDWFYLVYTPVDTCPSGCFCTGDDRCWPQPGWWSVDESVSVAPMSCLQPLACPGALQTEATHDSPDPVVNADGSRNTQRCELGYTGQACSQCADGFFKAEGACRSCGGAENAYFAGVLLAAVTFYLWFAAIFMLASPFQLVGWVSKVGYAQVAVTLGKDGASALSSKYAWLQQVFVDMAIVNWDVDMFHPGCSMVAPLSFVQVFWVTLILIGAVAVLFVFASFLRAFLIRQHIRRSIHDPIHYPDGYWKMWRREPAYRKLQPVTERYHDLDDLSLDGSPHAVRTSKVASHEQMIAFVDSWPSCIRADLTVGYRKGRSSTLCVWRMSIARVRHALLALAVLVYLKLTSLSLQVLNCTDQGGVQMLGDGQTVCWTGSQQGTAAFAVLVLVFYTAGFPILLALFLGRIHANKYDTAP